MADPSNNLYKSRIFNTVSQQYRQFLDRCGRTLRQVRLTASHATQILLYPVYVLIQGTRMVGKQLKAHTNIAIPQLNDSPQTTDVTVEEILQTLTLPNIQVQGIASRLDNHQLVLVASQTQTLHPLTFSQQKSIQQQITNTLPHNTQTTWNLPTRQPAIPAMGLILPVYCMMSQAMGWVQASPVAMRMNLFGESALAQVEPISVESTVVISNTQLSQNSIISDEDNTSNSSTQGLIQAAIRYFFNSNPAQTHSIEQQYYQVLDATENLSAITGSEKQVSILPQSQTSGILQKMQHSSFPLFAGIGVGGFLVAATLSQYILEPKVVRQHLDEHKANPVKFTPAATSPQHPSTTQAQWDSDKRLTSAENYDNSKARSNFGQSSTVGLQPAYSEKEPEILDTPVTAVEYVKHPLEKLLEWLDGAMYWVEESFLKFRSWILNRIQ